MLSQYRTSAITEGFEGHMLTLSVFNNIINKNAICFYSWEILSTCGNSGIFLNNGKEKEHKLTLHWNPSHEIFFTAWILLCCQVPRCRKQTSSGVNMHSS